MSRCTAPSRGHRSASAAANCPACSSRRGGYGGYTPSYVSSYPSYSTPQGGGLRGGSSGGSGSGGAASRTAKPRWSPASSGVFYTPDEVRSLNPVRSSVE